MIEEHKRWMAASDVIPMFPSLVWKIQLEAGLRDSLNSRIGAALADLRRDTMLSSFAQPLSQPLWGGENSS